MVAALHFVEEEIFYFIQATERPGNLIRGKIKDTLVPADDCDDDGDVFWDSYIFCLLPFKLFYSILHCSAINRTSSRILMGFVVVFLLQILIDMIRNVKHLQFVDSFI